MLELEPWIVRTASVIGIFFLVDVVLYIVNVRVERRRPARSGRTGRVPGEQHHSAAAWHFADNGTF